MMARLFVAAVMAVVLCGCAGLPDGGVFARSRSESMVAVAGVPLVFAAPEAAGLAAGPVEARLGGRAVPAWVSRVVFEPGRDAAGATWSGSGSVRWVAAGADDDSAVSVVVVEIPEGSGSGVLEVAGVRRDVRVWPRWRPAAVGAVTGEVGLYGADGATASDFWRYALAGFDAGVLVDRAPAERAAALFLAAEWEAGLARLEIADRWLAGRVMVALTRTAEVSGVRAPAWSADGDADDRLRRDLLDESLSGVALAERARAWLRLQPVIAVRVRDPASAGVVAVQVTDLAGRGSAASVSDGRRSGASAYLGGYASVEVPAPVLGDVRGGDSLITSAGVRSVSMLRPEEVLVAEPPGARVGPFFFDLSMREWLDGGAEALGSDAAVAGLVYRRAHANVWELYIECKAEERFVVDRVYVWLGPRGESVGVIELERGGGMRLDRVMGSVALVGYGEMEDRWSATVTLPAEAIEPGGVVRLGVVREFGESEVRLRRASWPVALLPWEGEPGRLAISLTEWFGLSR